MNRSCVFFIGLFALTSAGLSGNDFAQVQLKLEPSKSIRGAHYPALSADGKQLCFEYLGDLWIVASEGGNTRRLTVHRAYDAYPSPKLRYNLALALDSLGRHAEAVEGFEDFLAADTTMSLRESAPSLNRSSTWPR